MVKTVSEQQEARVLRAISAVSEDVNNLKSTQGGSSSELAIKDLTELVEESFREINYEIWNIKESIGELHNK